MKDHSTESKDHSTDSTVVTIVADHDERGTTVRILGIKNGVPGGTGKPLTVEQARAVLPLLLPWLEEL